MEELLTQHPGDCVFGGPVSGGDQVVCTGLGHHRQLAPGGSALETVEDMRYLL